MIRFALLFVLPAFLVSCSTFQSKKGVTARIADYVGKAVRLSTDSSTLVTPGTRVYVRLRTRSGTGYSWRYTNPAPERLKPAGSESFRSRYNESKAGGSVHEVWLFDAREEGEVALTYVYRRPWKDPANSTRTNVFVVRIKH